MDHINFEDLGKGSYKELKEVAMSRDERRTYYFHD